MKSKILLFLLLLSTVSLFSQTPQCPFKCGFNLDGWFEQGSANQISNWYTKNDFENLVTLGCDHIRIPIHLFNMSGEAPDYKLDPIFLMLIDGPVNWAEELGLYIILDNHSFDPAITTDPAILDQLIAVWQQMAEHYKDYSTFICYEILNEPHDIDDATWHGMQQQVIDAIRAIDNTHTIVVGPANWNTYWNLHLIPDFGDDNLIYTFHFYDPFLFTHQGATWTDPLMTEISNIPYPYDAARMQSMPASVAGSWIGDLFDTYSTDGTKENVHSRIDVAIKFQDERQVPIHCGEFGALQTGSTTEERALWARHVREKFVDNDVAWTMWTYKGGFGIFKPGSTERFPTDLDIPIVEALGLNVPPYEQVEIFPDTTGLKLYDDFVNQLTQSTVWAWRSIINFYSNENPKQGDYCIKWSDAARYEAFGWQFSPAKDFSVLLNERYQIRFWLKANAHDIAIDIRFIDTDLQDGLDHPWRMSKTIDKNIARLDGTWEQVDIPLQDMVETGSWHNDNWYIPVGDFDWSQVDILQFVAEHQDLQGISIYLDDIQILKVLNPSLTLISPNGGEQWLVGSQQTITWESQDINHVKIEYSLDNADTWNLIAASVAASEKGYNWQVPDSSSKSCFIKISNASNDSLFDINDNNFSIIDPAITLVTPNGGEEWLAGSQQTISWTSQDIENVKIEYSLDNGVAWNIIATSIPAIDESYNWQVLMVSSKNCLIKISNVSNEILFDESDNKFTIMNPSITIVSPNGGERWLQGSLQNITWTSQDVDKIKIENSINNGSNWQTIISEKSSADLSYEWTIPTTMSDQCIVKIICETNNAIFDESDNTFNIVAPSTVHLEKSVPTEFELFDNYPNPFNASTVIKFGIPESGNVKINIFNSVGHIVCKWIDSYFHAGYHDVIFQSAFVKRELSSGIYYYKIETKDFTSAKKMILIK